MMSEAIVEKQDGAVSVEVVDSDAAFDNLEDVWNDLVETADCTIYQTFEWQRTWWKYFGKSRKLNVLVMREGSTLVGIVPMFIERKSVMGIAVLAVLQFLGSEESDYNDVISPPGYREIVINALVNYLSRPDRQWDCFEIRDVSERFETITLLPARLAAAGFKVHTYKGNVCPQVSLPKTWSQFLEHLGGNLRYQLKKKTERLNKSHQVVTEIVTSGDAAVKEAVGRFAAIHGQRWEGLGYINAFKDPHFLAFHVEAAQKFARRGWLRMLFLNVDGVRVAVNFDFNFRGRIYFYHGNAYASDEIMKFSPGFLLRCTAIEQGIAEGIEVYDMLRGNETYKANDFKCMPIGNWQIRAVPQDFPARVLFSAFLFQELLGKIPKRIRREFQDYRRFSKTKDPSPAIVLEYGWERLKDVSKLGRYYVDRFFGRSTN